MSNITTSMITPYHYIKAGILEKNNDTNPEQ